VPGRVQASDPFYGVLHGLKRLVQLPLLALPLAYVHPDAEDPAVGKRHVGPGSVQHLAAADPGAKHSPLTGSCR